MRLAEVLDLASQFTVQQFLARDNYKQRLNQGEPVGLHEFFYALPQGYDAVHLHADVQLGTAEQLFNILAGAKLQEAFGQSPCVALTFPILVGLDGVERISKSRGNYLGLTEPPDEQFGKIMRSARRPAGSPVERHEIGAPSAPAAAIPQTPPASRHSPSTSPTASPARSRPVAFGHALRLGSRADPSWEWSAVRRGRLT